MLLPCARKVRISRQAPIWRYQKSDIQSSESARMKSFDIVFKKTVQAAFRGCYEAMI
jgi:hypothetical protein